MKTVVARAFGKAALVACAMFAFVAVYHHGGLPTDPHHHTDRPGTSSQTPATPWCPPGFTDIQCGA